MVTSLRALTNKLPRTVYLQVRSQPPQPPGQQPPGSQPPNGSTQLVSLVCQVFLPMVMRYGFPDCLLTDKGREWALIVFVCFMVEQLQRPPAGRAARRAWRRARRQRQRRRVHRYVKSKRNVRRLCHRHYAAALPQLGPRLTYRWSWSASTTRSTSASSLRFGAYSSGWNHYTVWTRHSMHTLAPSNFWQRRLCNMVWISCGSPGTTTSGVTSRVCLVRVGCQSSCASATPIRGLRCGCRLALMVSQSMSAQLAGRCGGSHRLPHGVTAASTRVRVRAVAREVC